MKIYSPSIFIIIFFVIFSFSNIKVAAAGPCGTLGGDCYTACEGDHSTALSTGDAGCANLSGKFCCKKPSVSSGSTGGIVPIVPDEGKKETGNYGVNDFLLIGKNIATLILGISGSLALLMFIYGGFMMLISSGSQEKIKKARDILVGAVIGLVIIFTSYIIIGFIWHSLNDKISVTDWAKSDFFLK